MSLKNRMQPLLAEALTSDALRDAQRQLREGWRCVRRRGHRISAWLKPDDGYSLLLAQRLLLLQEHYAVQLAPVTLGRLPHALHPEPALEASNNLRDAAQIAALHGLSFPPDARLPSPESLAIACGTLALLERDPRYLHVFVRISSALLAGDILTVKEIAGEFTYLAPDQTDSLLQVRERQLLDAGHYQSAMLHYAGEWYWGVDRLPYLCQRLAALNARHSAFAGEDFLSTLRTPAPAPPGSTLEFFFSFRSPYSWLALSRVYDIAALRGYQLQVRPVLPMVMRGLSVPAAKRFYILRDARREALRHGIGFGRIADPLGPGVDRCMALHALACQAGVERTFLETVARAIWSQGVDVAGESLLSLAAECGLSLQDCRQALLDEHWRQCAEQNRERLYALGLWGVPSFVLTAPEADEPTLISWGQDRLMLL